MLATHNFLHAPKEFTPQFLESTMVIPVVNSHTLLSRPVYRRLLDDIAQCSGLDRNEFAESYYVLIENFANLVQLLPEKSNDRLGSLFHNSLVRAANCLYHLCKQFPDSGSLERFALFSAALLHTVHYVTTQQQIFICGETGVLQKAWNPQGTTLLEQATTGFYRIMSQLPKYQRIDTHLTVLLAKQSLTDKLFTCLSQDLNLFTDWLLTLTGEGDADGIRNSLILQLYKQGEMENYTEYAIAYPFDDIKLTPALDTQLADQFTTWLGQQIDADLVKVNTRDAQVQVIQGGNFLFVSMQQLADFLATVKPMAVGGESSLFVLKHALGNLIGAIKFWGADPIHAKMGFNRSENLSSFSMAHSHQLEGVIIPKNWVSDKPLGISPFNLQKTTATPSLNLNIENSTTTPSPSKPTR